MFEINDARLYGLPAKRQIPCGTEEKSPALLLGTFDGVHAGHRSLIEKSRELEKAGMYPLAVLFSQHPAKVLGRSVSLLNTQKEREELIRYCGARCEYIDFTPRLASMPAAEYARMLCERFKPGAIIVGRNHTFGRDAAGTPATLAALREEYGFRLYVMPGVNWQGETVSSTRIRDCIRQGDTDSAKAMLGYDYGFCGQVQKGRHIGTSLGFPTANIEFPKDKVSPPDGVYCVSVNIGGKRHGGIMNIGMRPTFDNGRDRTYECNIFSCSDGLYGRELEVRILKRLREEIRFDSPQALKEQIERDAAVAAAYFKTLDYTLIF